jgi:hypothetical protein
MFRGTSARPIRSTADFDQIGVPEALAIVENRDDFRRNPEQYDLFQLSRRLACDLRELLEH